MPIFQHGGPAVAMRYVDTDGVEHHVVRAYLGEQLVWDGTIPAIEDVPALRGAGSLLVPVVRAGATIPAPVMLGSGGLCEPTPGGGGSVLPPVLDGAGALPAPTIGGGAAIPATPMEGTGQLLDPGVGTEVAGSAMVPTMLGAGSIPAPSIHVPATAATPVLAGQGAMLEVQVGAGAAIDPTVMTGDGAIQPPAVAAAAATGVPALGGAGQMPVPTHAAGHSLAVPTMSGEGQMPVPTVEALNFPPSGMNKSGNYTLPSTNTWHTVPTWAIRSGYPDTIIAGNGIEVPAGAEVTIAGQLTFGYSDSFSGNGMRMRVMAGSTQIGAVAGTPGNGTVAALTPFTWKNETGATQLITVQGYSTSSSFGRNIVQGGVNSYLTLVAVVPLVERAADNFDDGPGGVTGPLPEEWVTTGGGTLDRVNGRLNGVGTPSVPLSYAWWHEPMPSDTQVVRAVMRWDGYDPEHSACGLVVRANPFVTPSNPGTENGVQFSWTRGIMALYYEDYDATNGYVPVTGTAQYVSTSKFPEGAVVELRAEGNLYTARVNGTIMLQGTVENSVIPFSNRYVGLTLQDDSAISGGGGPPGRLDDFQALTP